MGDQNKILKSDWSAPLLFNPAFLSAEALKRLFLVRHEELDSLLRKIRVTTRTVPHTLIIGDPGMGKTTLLMRLALAVEEDPVLGKTWLPIRFSEELYFLGDLADLWLRVLEILVDQEADRELGGAVSQLKESHKDSREQLGEVVFETLKRYAKANGRRILLLIDNFELVLRRLEPSDRIKSERAGRNEKKGKQQPQWRLRELLSHEDFFMLIAANPEPIPATMDYGAPLYEFFDVVALSSIELPDAKRLFAELAKVGNAEDLIAHRPEPLLAIHPLVGGNLRALVTLYNFLRSHPEADLWLLFSYLLDQHTRFFKDQVDSLPDQAQRVFDALAKAVHPTTAEWIAGQLDLERGVVSAQLHRLVDRNLVLKRDFSGRKLGFLVRDRFFNSWCLMRSGNPWRQQLQDLVGLLQLFFRPYRSEDGRRRRMWNLLQNLRAATREELQEMLEPRAGGQEELFGKGREADIFCAYQNGDFRQVKSQASNFFGAKSRLVNMVHLRALEDLGELDAALAHLEALIEKDSTWSEEQKRWLDLEQTRLLGRLGKTPEALQKLVGLLGRNLQPAADLALELREIVRLGPPLAGIAELLLAEVEKVAVRDLSFLQIRCEMAWEAENIPLAMDRLSLALMAMDPTTPESARSAIFGMLLRFAATEPKKVGDVLKSAKLHERWQPVGLAIEVLASGDPESLTALAPEMVTVTEMILDRINSPLDPRRVRTRGAGT